jgi:hypothetical protein
MAETILILGESGQGKSTSLRNLDPKETFIISTTSKPLPWRGWKKQYTKFDAKENTGNWCQTSKSANIGKIIKFINAKRPEIKNIVVDDLQYTMCFEYMDRRTETGFQKFNDIGGDFTDLLRLADSLRDDLTLIFTAHSENTGDAVNPHWTLKTIGKMVQEKVTPEGLFTYVFYAMAIPNGDGMDYKFLTNSDGEHVAKTPMGMYDTLLIDNDMKEILDVIDKYNNGE